MIDHNKLVILLDMDGVDVDFVSSAFAVHGRKYVKDEYPIGTFNLGKVLGMSDDEFWSKITERQESFWIELKEYPWSDKLYKVCRNIVGDNNIIFCSSPSRDPYSAAGKLIWLQRKFADPAFNRYILTSHKELLANKSVLLIDDNEDNVNTFRKAGGKASLFPQPWNKFHALDIDEWIKDQELLIKILNTRTKEDGQRSRTK